MKKLLGTYHRLLQLDRFFRKKTVFVLGLFFLSGMSSTLYAQIVAYDLGASSAATAGIAVNYPDQDRIMNTTGLTSSGYSSTNGQTCYGWNVVGTDAWVTSSFSTEGYINITGSFQMKGNTTYGPKDFKIQYSLDGSSWIDASDGNTVTLTNELKTYNFSLPSDCENQSSLYVRWVLNSTLRLDGGTLKTSSGYNASLKGVSIAGDVFVAPSTQASNISIIAVTPKTIKINCTNGNGNNRIIMINTIDSFTDPVDDYYPTANTDYSSKTGEQVIYNGSESQVTVTVSSTTDEFWFRVYDYNKMDDLTRYNVIENSSNPKQCQLETIHSPTATDIRLTRATLGATITTPTSGTIAERGFFWSLTSPVDEKANMVNENTNEGGLFSIADIDVDRGTTIYYKGYVTNGSGTNMSEEASFSNVPVFSGTGNWETASLWNVNEVPGENGENTYGSVEDNPIINGSCTLTADNNVTNLMINSGNKLTISPAVTMQVDGTLTNNAGVSGLLIKASSSEANGSLIYADGSDVQASVEMYSKASWNLSKPSGSRYTWQYFGIPVQSLVCSSSFTGAYVRKWAENVDDYDNVWVKDNDDNILQLSDNSEMTACTGYELVQENPKTYTFKGTLYHDDLDQTLPFTASAYFEGQTVLSNPYLAAMNIADLSFGPNTEATVYLYNTGTYNDWFSSDGETIPGSGPGTYTVSTPETAGVDGIPAQIPSMQGFLVKATASTGSVSYSYDDLLGNAVQLRTSEAKTTEKIYTRIDLIGNTFSDRMWLFTFDNCTNGFDNGYDGRKILGYSGASQIYGIDSTDIYQIDAVSNVNGTDIGFQPGDVDTSFVLQFKHFNLDQKYSSLYLADLVTNTITDISNDSSEYSFTATKSDPINRFKIITSATGLNDINTSSFIDVIENKGDLTVFNKASFVCTFCLYNMSGQLIVTKQLPANSQAYINENLQKGVFVYKVTSAFNNASSKVIVK
jgi:hypothetical protein